MCLQLLMKSVCGERIPLSCWEQRKKAELFLRVWFITSCGNRIVCLGLPSSGGQAKDLEWWPLRTPALPATIYHQRIFSSAWKALRWQELFWEAQEWISRQAFFAFNLQQDRKSLDLVSSVTRNYSRWVAVGGSQLPVIGPKITVKVSKAVVCCLFLTPHSKCWFNFSPPPRGWYRFWRPVLLEEVNTKHCFGLRAPCGTREAHQVHVEGYIDSKDLVPIWVEGSMTLSSHTHMFLCLKLRKCHPTQETFWKPEEER